MSDEPTLRAGLHPARAGLRQRAAGEDLACLALGRRAAGRRAGDCTTIPRVHGLDETGQPPFAAGSARIASSIWPPWAAAGTATRSILRTGIKVLHPTSSSSAAGRSYTMQQGWLWRPDRKDAEREGWGQRDYRPGDQWTPSIWPRRPGNSSVQPSAGRRRHDIGNTAALVPRDSIRPRGWPAKPAWLTRSRAGRCIWWSTRWRRRTSRWKLAQRRLAGQIRPKTGVLRADRHASHRA